MAADTSLPKVLVTQGVEAPRDVVVRTPAGMPDFQIVVMPALLQVLVRATRTYLQSFLGFLGVTAIGGSIPGNPLNPPELGQKVLLAAGLALAPTLVSVVQNLIELLAKVDTAHPELRG